MCEQYQMFAFLLTQQLFDWDDHVPDVLLKSSTLNPV